MIIIQKEMLSPKIIIFSLAILSFIVSFNGEFAFDDHRAIVNNKVVIRPPEYGLNIKEILINDFWGTPIRSRNSHKSYRPLPTLIFRIGYLINGLDTKIYHIFNILIHGCNSILLYDVLKIWIPNIDEKVYLYTGIIFAIHPIHCDAVASIVGVTELLMAFFFLLGMKENLIYKDKVTIKYLFYTILSLFSKEQGIMLLPLSILQIIIYYKKITKKSFQLSILTIFLIYIRLYINNFEEPKFSSLDNPMAFTKSIFSKLFTQLYIYLINIKLLLWPWYLSIDYSMGTIPLIENCHDLRFLIIFLLIIICPIILINRISKILIDKEEKYILFNSISLYILTFLPSSNIFFTVGFVIAERTLYLPSIGFCLLLTYYHNKYENNINKYINGKIFFKTLILILLIKTVQRSHQWLREEDLYQSSLQTCPKNAKLYYNLGKIYTKQNKIDDAIDKYKEAIKLWPGYCHAMNNLANLYEGIGKYSIAEELLKKCTIIEGTFPVPWMNLGILQMKMGKYNESEYNLIKSIHLRPSSPDGFFNLGNLYLNMKLYHQARDAYKNATSIDKKHLQSWVNLLILEEEHFDCYNIDNISKVSLEENNNKGILHHQIAKCFFKINNYVKAEYHFEKAVDLDKNNHMYRKNLEIFYKYINMEGIHL
uniref:dolichyl-phosphate-mannose--protein mannosyltransferase n=1 Tax=Strongyloides stercoralis TaxID=6248 RepID=A0A0K0EAW1_STRER